MCNVQWDFSSLTRQKNFPNWGESFSWLYRKRQPFMVLFVLSRIFLALSPMVLEEEERYMFGEHIPKMYLTYTPLCTF
jgi:hypothetical protein